MGRPRLFDLFCGAGGAAVGYARAGWEVVGVDLHPQPRYPYKFVQQDALRVLELWDERMFDAVHASPPCQAYTAGRRTQRKNGDQPYPDLIPPVRKLLREWSLPYVIENVPGAPLLDPITLCGQQFGLPLIRHRLFETNFPIEAPPHKPHVGSMLDGTIIAVYGGKRIVSGGALKGEEKYHNYGRIPLEFRRVDAWKKAMGIDWMTGRELKEAIPPAYTEWIGRQLIGVLNGTQVVHQPRTESGPVLADTNGARVAEKGA